eukprot:SAG22_NODE_2284_length_2758_cov_2.590071_3_plen_260_part_00
MQHREEARRRALVLDPGSDPAELLFAAVEGPADCDLAMAEEALRRNASAALAGVLRNKTGNFTARDIASAKQRSGLRRLVDSACADVSEALLQAQLEQAEGSPAIQLMKKSFADFVGMDELLFGELNSFAERIKQHEFEAKLNLDMKCAHEAWVLTGGPGTGKTSAIRLITPVLKEAGIISTSKFKEVSKNDVKGVHLGGTEEMLANLLEEYRGGVLFFDEAYTYKTKENDGDQYEGSILESLLSSRRSSLRAVRTGRC